jgi:DNA-binding transcriptional ArsR family regulator
VDYEVKIDYCEAYELISSFNAYTNKKSHKGLELGGNWIKNLREKLSPKLKEKLKRLQSLDVWLDLLLLDCPADKRTPIEFLSWVEALSVGELYERMSPWVPKGREAFHHLEDWRNEIVHLFSLWNEEYFQHIDSSILIDLQQDAQDKQQLLEKYSPIDVVEEVTNGLRIESFEDLKKVILVPQYHFRPFNLISKYQGVHIYYYPADTQSFEVDTPSPSLMRLTKSLADENRLRILRFLEAGDKSFTEIVQFIGLAKSTVHYHMVSLRSSGLVRVHLSTESGERYSLREGAIDQLRDHLKAYLGH